ncbi:MAG: autotransporter outer membrane beta-barrel domain-containing protein [Acidaminococcaceae bacterium]|nr:autotransporter outer membrane beta-barrel domain-containing protein [Acidaminococcaceae bacterium]
MTTRITKERKAKILLSVFALGATLCIAQPAVNAATYNINNEAQAWSSLGHEPGNAGHPMYVFQYYGKGSNNVLNLSPTGGFSPLGGYVPDFYAGHGSGHTLNLKGGGYKNLTVVGGTASDNKVVVTGGTADTVCGGCSYSSGYGNQNTPTNSNTVRISSGNINGSFPSIYGGRSASTASNNTVVISGGNLNEANIWGGYGSAANGNTVDVSGFDGSIKQLHGGDASGNKANASNNVVMLGNAKAGVYKGSIYGGDASGDNASANNNSVQILGGTLGADIYGGYANNGSAPTASNNTVELRKGVFTGNNIFGGRADGDSSPGVAYNNSVILYEPTFNGTATTIYGGYAKDGRAERNSVVILGGTVIGDIIAGHTGYFGVEKNNSIELYKVYDLNLTNAVLHGTKSKFNNALKDANPILNVYASDIKVKNIKNFAQINYYLPDTVKNGNTILQAVGTEGTDLRNTKVAVSVPGGTRLDTGDKINLLDTKAGIIGEPEQTVATFTEGVSIERDMDIKVEGKALVGTLLSGPFGGGGSGVQLKDDTKSLVETRSAAMAVLNNSIDVVTDKGFAAAKDAVRAETGSGFTPFVYTGGNKMRYKTGSHVDSRGWGLAAGFAKEIKGENHTLITGPFVEHGRANYDSYLDNGTKADGKNRFTGGGWFLRNELKNGINYEASVRFGHLSSDYKGYGAMDTEYDSGSNYLGFHAGVGKTLQVGKKDDALDVYAKYFYTHQNGTDATLSTGERYHFDAVNSNRIRLGARYTHPLKANASLYAGLAWDYEFDSDARATYRGLSTPSPSMKGSSGMLELGVKCQPSDKSPFHMDISLAGWAGKQRGVSFNAAFQWTF